MLENLKCNSYVVKFQCNAKIEMPHCLQFVLIAILEKGFYHYCNNMHNQGLQPRLFMTEQRLVYFEPKV